MQVGKMFQNSRVVRRNPKNELSSSEEVFSSRSLGLRLRDTVCLGAQTSDGLDTPAQQSAVRDVEVQQANQCARRKNRSDLLVSTGVEHICDKYNLPQQSIISFWADVYLVDFIALFLYCSAPS